MSRATSGNLVEKLVQGFDSKFKKLLLSFLDGYWYQYWYWYQSSLPFPAISSYSLLSIKSWRGIGNFCGKKLCLDSWKRINLSILCEIILIAFIMTVFKIYTHLIPVELLMHLSFEKPYQIFSLDSFWPSFFCFVVAPRTSSGRTAV